MKNKTLTTGFSPFLLLLVPALAAAQAPAAVGSSTRSVTVEQFYSQSALRDPLKVSTVFSDEHGSKSKVGAAELAQSTFSVYNLALTGILEDNNSKEAIFKDLGSGAIYILKGGKLLDTKKKQLPGISGLIKGKQVVLRTEDKKTHQLILHEHEKD